MINTLFQILLLTAACSGILAFLYISVDVIKAIRELIKDED